MDRRQFLQSAALAAVPFAGALAPLAFGNQGNFAQAIKNKPWLVGFVGTNEQLLQSQARITGTVPKQLRGSLYRNGPAQHEVFGLRYNHWFDGDGMAHKYTISDSGITHLGRMIETHKYTQERQAKKALYSAFDTIPPNPLPVSSPDQVNVANISMLAHHGELYALWEAGSAHSLDSQTLATKGRKAWSEETAGVAFSAHPRLDSNGELWNFGYVSSAKALFIWHIDRQGKLKRSAIIPSDPITMPHDFLLTKKHIVIPLSPFDFDPSAKGKTFLASHNWNPQNATRVLVIDKNTLEVTMTLELPAQWIFHYSNAWEDSAGMIRFEAPRMEDPGIMTQYFRQVMVGEVTPDQPWSDLYSYRIDTKGKRASEQPIFTSRTVCEFPSINKHYSTRQHSMFVMLRQSKRNPDRGYQNLDSVTVVNPKKESSQGYTYPEHQIPEEHIFVPHPEAKRESQGWILGTFIDYKKQKTGLNIFDAERVTEGPRATASLPYLVPLGLHGTFVPA